MIDIGHVVDVVDVDRLKNHQASGLYMFISPISMDYKPLIRGNPYPQVKSQSYGKSGIFNWLGTGGGNTQVKEEVVEEIVVSSNGGSF